LTIRTASAADANVVAVNGLGLPEAEAVLLLGPLLLRQPVARSLLARAFNCRSPNCYRIRNNHSIVGVGVQREISPVDFAACELILIALLLSPLQRPGPKRWRRFGRRRVDRRAGAPQPTEQPAARPPGPAQPRRRRTQDRRALVRLQPEASQMGRRRLAAQQHSQ
jgi:hypothetical protein